MWAIVGISTYICHEEKKRIVAPETNETTLDEVITDAQLPTEPTVPETTNETTSETTNETINVQFARDRNLDFDDLPTFDQALEMEIVDVENSQHKLRRRFSSRASMKNDELPDYETVSYETNVTTAEPSQCNPAHSTKMWAANRHVYLYK